MTEITDKIKAQQREESIKTIEKEHSLFMQAPMAIQILKGPELTIELANEPTLAIWRKGKEVIGKPLKEVLPELVDQGYIDLLNKVRKTGEVYEAYETPAYLLRDGKEELTYFNIFYKPYYEGETKTATGVLVFANEVTDEVAARNAIKTTTEENRNLAAIVEASQEFIALATPDGLGLYANPAALQLLGWETVKGRHIEECIYAPDRELARGLLERLRKEGRFSHEIRFYNEQTGQPFWMLWNGFTINDPVSGEVISLATVSANITESKQIEQALNESHERFEAAIEAIEGILWTNNAEGKMEGEQKGWAKLTGQSYNEYQGYGWAAAVHPDDAQPTIDAWNEAVSEKKTFVFEHRVKTAEGRYDVFSIRAIPLLNNDATVREWVGVHTNINEQKAAAEAVKRSEQRIRSLVESAPFPIGVYVGSEMQIELANQTIIDIYGKGPDVIGKSYKEILPELASQHVFEQLDQVYTTGQPFHAKSQQVDIEVDGQLKTHYFSYSFTPLFDGNGKVYGVMNTAADVTDLALAKQEVEKGRENLRNMILQAPVAMCIMKGDDYIVEVANERMFEIWGKQPEQVLNKPMFVGLPEAKEQGIEALLQNVYVTGETFQAFEMPVKLPRNGNIETVYINFVYEPFYEREGKITGIIAVAVDVTEQVLARQKIEEIVAQRTKELADANAALVKSNADLKRSNVNLEEFAYAASHDLKEPIRKIHFFSDRLKSSLSAQMTEAEKQSFERMESAAKRMGSLIDDLLAYSQVSLRPAAFEEVDLAQVMDLVLADLDLEIEQKGANVEVGKLCIVRGHHRQLQQAFQNLIGNAIKYSKPDTPPHVTVNCKLVEAKETGLNLSPEQGDKSFWLIGISDNGIGFEQRDADRIFNVFTRLHGNVEYRGTGVGLSIVRKVVENHQGYITAQSELGKGSTFRLYLPAGEDQS